MNKYQCLHTERVFEMDGCCCSNPELKSSKTLEILKKDTSTEQEKDRIFGYLLTIDLYGIESSKCDDLNLGYDFLDKLPCYLGMNKQSLPHIYVTPAEWIGKGGLSGWVGIVESGIQLHTLSAEGFVSIDMYTCSYLDQSMIPKILEFVHKYYPYEDVETNFVKRGLKYYKNGK